MVATTTTIEAKKEAIRKAKQLRKNRSVEVVTCPEAFPISKKAHTKRKPIDDSPEEPDNSQVSSSKLLDWEETAKEVRSLGASAFVGEQKRNYKEEQYEFLTGRKLKKHQVPLPIVRGIKKAARKREATRLKEAREAGIVLPKMKRESKEKVDNNARIHGPAPSIGFMRKGVLKLRDRP